MVLQLIMFFMICVSFVGHESDFELRLPVMEQHACPPEPSENRLVLNVDQAGMLHVSDHQPLQRDGDILSLLNAWAKKGDADRFAPRLVVIRADARADYRTVHHLMTLCKKAGLSKFQLRTVAAS
jgi:biopolymer transport protein ExbD